MLSARWLIAPVVLSLAAGAPVRAGEKQPVKSAPIVVRIKSIDEVINSGKRVLVSMLGAEMAQKAEMQIAAQFPNGLQGIDTTKPLGMYGNLDAEILKSPLIVLVPISDEKDFVALLENLQAKVEKGNDGIYKVSDPGGEFSVHFRFANKYAYFTLGDKGQLDVKKLLTPAKALPPEGTAMISARVQVHKIPQALRKIASDWYNDIVNQATQQPLPGATPAVKQLFDEYLRWAGQLTTTFLNDAEEYALRFNPDWTMEQTVSGRPGTKLAKTIADMAKVKSLFAGMLPEDAAVNGLVNVVLPEGLQKALVGLVEETATNIEGKPGEKLIKVLLPSLKAGHLDVAVSLRGPSPKKLYTGILGVRLKDGQAVEKALQTEVAKLPAEIRKRFTFDKGIGKERIHKIDLKDLLPDGDKVEKIFGQNPVYLAFRDDALFLVVGEKGLVTIKQALKLKPKEAAVFRAEAALGRFAEMVSDDPQVQQEFRMLGTIRYTIEGGKTLTSRMSGMDALFTLFGMVSRIRMAGGGANLQLPIGEAVPDAAAPQARLLLPRSFGVRHRLRAGLTNAVPEKIADFLRTL
jgi:hypothetical protein